MVLTTTMSNCRGWPLQVRSAEVGAEWLTVKVGLRTGGGGGGLGPGGGGGRFPGGGGLGLGGGGGGGGAGDEVAVGVGAEHGAGQLGEQVAEFGVLLGRPVGQQLAQALAAGREQPVGGGVAGVGEHQRP